MANTDFEVHHEHEPTPREPTRKFQLPRSLHDTSFIQNTLALNGVYDARSIALLQAQWVTLETKHLNTFRRSPESWMRFATHFRGEVKKFVGDEPELPRAKDLTDSLDPSNPLHMLTEMTVMATRGILHLGRLVDRDLSGTPTQERHLDPAIDLEQLYDDFMRTEHDDGHLSVKLPE